MAAVGEIYRFGQSSPPLVTLFLTLATTAFSFVGFRDDRFRDRFIFWPEAILAGKQYYRILTSAFLHANWPHLIFNMYTLYAFGGMLEMWFGIRPMLTIYFASIVGGSLLSLWLHRHHDYRAYGASGGVCGIVFASIFLLPGGGIMLFPLPYAIPSWLYAILFLAATFYGIRARRDNIGHDAHLGGAVAGLAITAVLYPRVVRESPVLFATVTLLTFAFMLSLWKLPLWLPNWRIWFAPKGTRRLRRDAGCADDSAQIDSILEKISASGIQSLTKKEQELLKRQSKRDRR